MILVLTIASWVGGISKGYGLVPWEGSFPDIGGDGASARLWLSNFSNALMPEEHGIYMESWRGAVEQLYLPKTNTKEDIYFSRRHLL